MTDRPIPVLLYHGVGDPAAEALHPWILPCDRFGEQVDQIVASGRTPLTVSQLIAGIDGGTLPRFPVVVTFDDGLAGTAGNAWPLLHDAGVVATLYVVTDLIGGRAGWLAPFGRPIPPMMTWDQVGRLAADGWEIGSHGCRHRELDTITGAAVSAEVMGSRDALAEQLGEPPVSFAYPYGYADRRVRQAVREAGYTSACGVREGLSSGGDDRFQLARMTITDRITADQFKAILAGGYGPVTPSRRPIRTTLWRTWRRGRAQMVPRYRARES